MKTLTINNDDAGNKKWFAFQDAKMRSAVNATRFTDKQKIKAERVKLALELVYSASKFTIDYNKKFIRVKAHDANIKDRRNLRELEQQWDKEGIVRVITNQGIIYRVM